TPSHRRLAMGLKRRRGLRAVCQRDVPVERNQFAQRYWWQGRRADPLWQWSQVSDPLEKLQVAKAGIVKRVLRQLELVLVRRAGVALEAAVRREQALVCLPAMGGSQSAFRSNVCVDRRLGRTCWRERHPGPASASPVHF